MRQLKKTQTLPNLRLPISSAYNRRSVLTSDNHCMYSTIQALRQREDGARPEVLREAGDGDGGGQPAGALLPADQRAHVRTLHGGPHRRRQVRMISCLAIQSVDTVHFGYYDTFGNLH